MDHVGSELPSSSADLAADFRNRRGLAEVIVRPSKMGEFRVETEVGRQVHRDRRDAVNRGSAGGHMFHHDGDDLDLMAEPFQASDDVEPEVLVSGVAEGEVPGANQEYPHASVPGVGTRDAYFSP